MRGWRKTLLRVGQKEKLLGAQDQGTAQGWLRHWPERLPHIISNYIRRICESNINLL